MVGVEGLGELGSSASEEVQAEESARETDQEAYNRREQELAEERNERQARLGRDPLSEGGEPPEAERQARINRGGSASKEEEPSSEPAA